MIEVRPAESFAKGAAIVWHNLLSDWPELLLGYGSTGLLLLGGVYVLRRPSRRHEWFWPVVVWSIGLAIYYVLELHQMEGHTYYMLPLLPVLLLLAAVGSEWLRRLHRWHWLLALLLVAQPVWACLRVVPRWAKGPKDVPAELYYPATRTVLENAVPNDALCLVGPDESGCKFFYFLHKKGFGLDVAEQLDYPTPEGQPYVAACIARGARYLYLSDSTLLTQPRLAPYVGKRIARVGTIQVLELRLPPPTAP
ncbi:hypothetical protein [Hymenobacter elongatus]|uniref:4-amino-4-deoxy-L-arabinose transferase n=1 Tax=Hymenobacter elongatus TaxID=877208 RepID=A0A4Z0PEQ8_9BACT|nr:hypothetical protein [Hymenobacter elongatus]TGE13065.1 hypothetical protein E5J99_19690 [Hymenobacter elongatus]